MAIAALADFFSYWQKHFDRDVPKTRWERFWVTCHGTGAKWSILIGVAVFILASLDGVMARSSILDAGPTIRFVSGIYGCIWGVYVFAFKRDLALRTVNQLLRVALQVESGRLARASGPATKDLLRRTARGARRYLRGMDAWSGMVFVTVLVPALLKGEPANPSWPPPTTPLGYWALFTLHVFSTVFLPAGFFPLTAMISGVLNCSGALLRAVGEVAERAADDEELRQAALLSAELNEGLSMLNALFNTVIAHMLQSTLLMPLIATYEVLNGQVDPFLFATGPLNVIIFIPICFAGQSMEDASSAMSDCAYWGRWLEEGTRCRKIRLQMMQRVARPTQLTSRELGAVNLALCQNSLQRWFSYLNFLLSTKKRGRK